MGLILVAATLQTLKVPAAGVAQALGQVRDDRYALLSNVRPHTDSPLPTEAQEQREEIRTVVIPPGAWAVGRSVEEVRGRGAVVAFTGSADTGYWARRRRAQRACGKAMSS